MASSWAPLARDRQGRVLVGRGGELILLSHNDMAVLELRPDPEPSSTALITMVATSHSQVFLASHLQPAT